MRGRKLSRPQILPRNPCATTASICVPRQNVEPTPQRESHAPEQDGELNLQRYLREIRNTPLLKAEDEVRLAALIQNGSSEARELMIRSNLRLVVKIAREFQGMGLALLDMINEGNIGLMRAVDRFDPAKGAKVSTYASWWIKQSIRRALANQGKTIRIPTHLVDLVAKIRRVSMRLQEELGREPNDAEIAETMGLSRERVTELLTASYRPVSLEAPVGEEGDVQLQDLVADENAQNAYQNYERQSRRHILLELLEHLDPREMLILSRRFGLDGNQEKTLEEVGNELGVTRERIRQVQHSTLLKLRRWMERQDQIQDPELETYCIQRKKAQSTRKPACPE